MDVRLNNNTQQAAQVIDAIERLEKEGDRLQADKLRDELNPYGVNRAHRVAREAGQLKNVRFETEPSEDNFILVKDWVKMSEEERKESLSETDSETKFNGQTDGNIEWAQFSWNPLTGCKHGCDYCFARDIAERLFTPRFEPAFYPGRLHAPANTAQPEEAKTNVVYKNVFTCSMADLFGKFIPDDLIELVLETIGNNPKWNFHCIGDLQALYPSLYLPTLFFGLYEVR